MVLGNDKHRLVEDARVGRDLRRKTGEPVPSTFYLVARKHAVDDSHIHPNLVAQTYLLDHEGVVCFMQVLKREIRLQGRPNVIVPHIAECSHGASWLRVDPP
jgi:hypothetical protein